MSKLIFFFILLSFFFIATPAETRKDVPEVLFEPPEPPHFTFQLKSESGLFLPTFFIDLKKTINIDFNANNSNWEFWNRAALQTGWLKKRGRYELAGLLTFSTIRYWIQENINKVDWDYNFNFSDQVKRFFTFQALRFDSNSFSLNWTHALAGGLYFNIARSNGYSFYQSMLLNALASTFWEYVSEFKEVISINDQVFTPIGGISIGETFFQFYRFFARSKPTTFNNLGKNFFGIVPGLNRFFFKDPPLGRANRFDVNGFAVDVDHNFKFSLRSDLKKGGTSGLINADLRLDFSRSEQRDSVDFSRFNISAGFCPDRLTIFNLDTEISFWGRNSDFLAGNIYLGASTAFSLKARRISERLDRVSTVHVFGPHLAFKLHWKDLQIVNRTRFWVDFALCNSLAIEQWKKDNDEWPIKTTLRNWNYYYSVGYTFFSEQEIGFKDFKLEGSVHYSHFYSIQGRDRYPQNVINNFALKDSRLLINLSLGAELADGLLFAYNSEWFTAYGELPGYVEKFKERQNYFSLSFCF